MKVAVIPVISSFLLLTVGCADQYGRTSTSTYPGTTSTYPQPSPGTPNPVISSPPAAPSSSGQVYNSSDGSSSDRALTERVEQTLRSDSTISTSAKNVQVSARNGAVTITGTVNSDQDRQKVDNLVRNLAGVTAVYDQLQIVPYATGRSVQENRSYDAGQPQVQAPQVTGAQVGQNTVATGDIFNLHVQGLNETDRSLAQRILQGLNTDQLLASLFPTVNINVSGGKVVLQGTVQSEKQKETIASVVQKAAGVNNVENQLQISSQ